MRRFSLCLILNMFFFYFTCLSQNEQAVKTLPLFESEEIIQLELAFNMKEFLKNKNDDEKKEQYFPARLAILDGEETSEEIGIKVRLRGNYRRKNCQLPPMRLNFPTSKVKNTVFEGQDKIKLVLPCRMDNEKYQQYLFEEYLTYKTYNLLTDYSFRVRMASVTFVDSAQKYDSFTDYAFMIEDVDHVAERQNMIEIETTKIHPRDTEREVANLMAVFQYMIGNTDWSIYNLHNVKFIKDTTDFNLPAPIPYDFDWCGLISAPYAKPNPIFEISHVRERLFRGFCRPEEEYEAAFQVFREKKDEIYNLFTSFSMMNEKVGKNCIKYLDDFYTILDSPKLTKRNILEACRTNN